MELKWFVALGRTIEIGGFAVVSNVSGLVRLVGVSCGTSR